MPRFRISFGLVLSLTLAVPASAQSLAIALNVVGFQHGGGGHGGGGGTPGSMSMMSQGHHHGSTSFPGAGNVINYNPGIFYGYGVGGGYGYSPSFFAGSGSNWGFAPIPYSAQTGLAWNFMDGVAPPGGPGGLMLPALPNNGLRPASRPTRSSPARSKELVELGDRSFRGGNTKKAQDRYLLAIKSDPTSVTPHVHLAQLALIRGKYKEAADSLRAAVAVGAGTGWLANAPDIQSIFGEPADFAKKLAEARIAPPRLIPGDRDAWVRPRVRNITSRAGAKLAADVFQRLTDRQGRTRRSPPSSTPRIRSHAEAAANLDRLPPDRFPGRTHHGFDDRALLRGRFARPTSLARPTARRSPERIELRSWGWSTGL